MKEIVSEKENLWPLSGQIVSQLIPKFHPVLAHADRLMLLFQLHHILKSNVIAVNQHVIL